MTRFVVAPVTWFAAISVDQFGDQVVLSAAQIRSEIVARALAAIDDVALVKLSLEHLVPLKIHFLSSPLVQHSLFGTFGDLLLHLLTHHHAVGSSASIRLLARPTLRALLLSVARFGHADLVVAFAEQLA